MQPRLPGGVCAFVVEQPVSLIFFAAAGDVAVLVYLHCADHLAQLLRKILRGPSLGKHAVEGLPDFKANVRILPPQPGRDVQPLHRLGKHLLNKSLWQLRKGKDPLGGFGYIVLGAVVFFDRHILHCLVDALPLLLIELLQRGINLYQQCIQSGQPYLGRDVF